jgi:hypothetical protein
MHQNGIIYLYGNVSTISTPQPTRTADIDISRGLCTTGSSTTPEPFGPDTFSMSVVNGLTERIFVQSVTIEGPVNGSANVVSEQQLGGLLINADSSVDFTGPFADPFGNSKVYSGTNSLIPSGTLNIRFTLVVRTASGQTRTIEQFATIRAFDFNACS